MSRKKSRKNRKPTIEFVPNIKIGKGERVIEYMVIDKGELGGEYQKWLMSSDGKLLRTANSLDDLLKEFVNKE